MNSAVGIWLVFRVLRWLCWIGAAFYYLEFMVHSSSHLNSFGHLLPTTEFWMFILPIAGIFIGFLELMMREKTGLGRPAFGRNWFG